MGASTSPPKIDMLRMYGMDGRVERGTLSYVEPSLDSDPREPLLPAEDTASA